MKERERKIEMWIESKEGERTELIWERRRKRTGYKKEKEKYYCDNMIAIENFACITPCFALGEQISPSPFFLKTKISYIY